ncbi:hypothetical protein KAR91_31220 [Candidatus Pacearchaeota archaeon]|nr:hypothetical protein [Candidatus Pacearchaeota archaeon]
MDKLLELPTYKSDATSEQKKANALFVMKQLRLIIDQEKNKTPSQFLKIRCGCNKLIQWKYMYRCLYCGIWFCRECAEKHFGFKKND